MSANIIATPIHDIPGFMEADAESWEAGRACLVKYLRENKAIYYGCPREIFDINEAFDRAIIHGVTEVVIDDLS